MDGLAAAQLAEQSIQYRGMASSEQEDLLTVALVRIEEGRQVPAPAPKDYWLRVRDELVRKVIALHTTVEATAPAAADQVLGWAISVGLDVVVYQSPLAILTAMVIQDVVTARQTGDQMARTADEAANWIIDRLSRSYSLDDEDKDRLRAFVRRGANIYRAEASVKQQPFEDYINELADKLDEAYAAEYRGETISLGPLSAHVLAAICPLWPFCT